MGGAAACSDDQGDGEQQFAVSESPRRLGVDGCRRRSENQRTAAGLLPEELRRELSGR
ncbi:MAG: hypothetical protein LBL04_09825 [Bacteroidales bacterium]|nr:hypothetical protein [Bacteroidales bacterium]